MSATYKIKFRDDIRRVNLATAPTFGNLVGMIREMYSINAQSRITLKYQDDEKDLVTLTSDAEMLTAQDIARIHFGNMLRLFVTAVDPRPESPLPMRFNPDASARPWFCQRNPLPAGVESKLPHVGVTCDNCTVSPIIGSRFKCTNCIDYDLCSKCMAITPSVHDHGHTLQEMPLMGGYRRFGRGPRRCGPPQAQEATVQSDVKISEQAPKSPELTPTPAPAQPEAPTTLGAPIVESTPTLLYPSVLYPSIQTPESVPSPMEALAASRETEVVPTEPSISPEEIQPLKTLIEMGFGGDLIAALRRNKGDLEATIGQLL